MAAPPPGLTPEEEAALLRAAAAELGRRTAAGLRRAIRALDDAHARADAAAAAGLAPVSAPALPPPEPLESADLAALPALSPEVEAALERMTEAEARLALRRVLEVLGRALLRAERLAAYRAHPQTWPQLRAQLRRIVLEDHDRAPVA